MEYALGMIETHGHTAAVEALDAASKASNIIFPSMVHVGSGRVAVSFFGDVSAVKVAVDCGVAAAERVGKVLGSNVIARLDKQVLNSLFEYVSSDDNGDSNKEKSDSEKKETDKNKQLESNTEIINENADNAEKENKESEEKETDENKQSESNTEIINENIDNNSSDSNVVINNTSLFDEDVNKKIDNETASNETVSKKKTRKKKKNNNNQ
ncbi:BMC domain-containing protein [Brachyspira innocens]|uniref:BMC domain-containing protein n=1 Tax=Brachyspira innocens TaxID=13264 RepID=A0ABT8YXH2_9SPIR|nr:BMC domain-containing protein [Brachyspira innocens]MDO6993391.1 BMC domain-containing protein [Brachyspira innocens]MDO7020311.1 BMC domain-containing protein [Brachyspira innocens]